MSITRAYTQEETSLLTRTCRSSSVDLVLLAGRLHWVRSGRSDLTTRLHTPLETWI